MAVSKVKKVLTSIQALFRGEKPYPQFAGDYDNVSCVLSIVLAGGTSRNSAPILFGIDLPAAGLCRKTDFSISIDHFRTYYLHPYWVDGGKISVFE